MTGGGCPVTIPNDPVMDAMDAATPNLDLEVWCPYDSTAEFEKECMYVHYKDLIDIFLYLNQYFE